MTFKQLDIAEVTDRIKKAGEGRYYLVSEYEKADKRIQLMHEDCGEIYKTTLNHFTYDGRRCPCEHKKKKADKFAAKFNKEANGEYTQLTSYESVHKKIGIRHNECGHEYYTEPNSWNRGTRCPNCFGHRRKTTEEFSKEVQDLSRGEYKLKDGEKYINNSTNIKFHHVEGCGYVYEATPKDFRRGNRCPVCKESKGERLVRYLLEDQEVFFETEKVFKDLHTNGAYLPYDFYIPESNLLIEYDGMQHFKPMGYFGGEQKLESQKRRDRKKDEYAKNKGIRLLRIPYYYSDEEVKQELISSL